MPQYNVSGIVYCRATDANLAIAYTNNGGTSDSIIEDVIAAPSLATGKITCSTGSATVSGTATTFVSQQLRVGQYLYAYSASGVPELIGQIASITNNTTLTLGENALLSRTLKNFGSSQNKLAGFESILIRIPVVVNATDSNANVTSGIIPDFREWRLPNNSQGVDGDNNPSSSNLVRYSNPGDPVSIDSTPTDANNIPFTITSLNKFSPGTRSEFVWTVGAIPNYIWARIDPYGRDGESLPQATMFYLFTATTFPNGLVATVDFFRNNLRIAGYSLT